MGHSYIIHTIDQKEVRGEEIESDTQINASRKANA